MAIIEKQLKDLFGVLIDEGVFLIAAKSRKGQPKGYSAPPGTGPVGETCATCKHFCRVTYSKTYFKCELLADRWTHGPGTDIRARSPACRNWKPIDDDQYIPLDQWDSTD